MVQVTGKFCQAEHTAVDGDSPAAQVLVALDRPVRMQAACLSVACVDACRGAAVGLIRLLADHFHRIDSTRKHFAYESHHIK